MAYMSGGQDGSFVPTSDYSSNSSGSSGGSNWTAGLKSAMGSSGGGKGGFSDGSSGDQYVNPTNSGTNDQGGKNLTSGRASGGIFGMSGAMDHSENLKNYLDNAFNQSFGANWNVNFSGTQKNESSQDFPFSKTNTPSLGGALGVGSTGTVLLVAAAIVAVVMIKKRGK